MNKEDIQKSIYTAFINKNQPSGLMNRPRFLSNDYAKGRKVSAAIEEELRTCDSFIFSVAFITSSGFTLLAQVLKELEERNVPGKILTTDYLAFSEPKALKQLHQLRNLEIRMYYTGGDTAGFHTKGYIFHHEDSYHMIIGSSNMTQSALAQNREWNSKIVSTRDGEFASNVLDEFDSLWNNERTKSFDDFIQPYEQLYQSMRKQRDIQHRETKELLSLPSLRPNSMQIGFINSLDHLRNEGKHKALLISATGTGKTYASAFAMQEENQKKVLFIVHREQIAKQAMESYKKVFKNTRTYGLLSGNSKQMDQDFIFATMQTISRDDILHQLPKDRFQDIIIDESHRVGAESYQKILSWFVPELWLGMTASPERTDSYDVFEAFDHNIAYEIRLQQALEENLLCPFHYFGITDLSVDGKIIDDETELHDFDLLTSNQRTEFILKQASYYGYSGSRVKGLVFCSTNEAASVFSKQFNTHGLHTIALSGSDSQEKRESSIERLVSDTCSDPLDYIFTVDIFNEGVDIPEVNQVILLRPTKSPIIFVQQLGRGLRKSQGKEYVVILDFIGSYANNYMIPIALSGDRSYNKDTMRRYVSEGNRMIPGCSSIHFDEIARERIYHSIDSARTNTMALIRKSYLDLKNMLGRIPCINDFDQYGSIDITKIFDKCGSYYNFLLKYEPDYKVRFSKEEESILNFISRKIAKGKRIDELILLQAVLDPEKVPDTMSLIQYCKIEMEHTYGIQVKDAELQSAIRSLTNLFAKTEEQSHLSSCMFLSSEDTIDVHVHPFFEQSLKNYSFKEMINELITFGISQYKKYYAKRYKDTALQLYQKYTYEDVCLLLNWKKDMNAQNIGGYFYDKDTHTMPVFINYEKNDDAIAYEDRFISEDQLIALSKHPRKITSSDADHIYHRTEADRDNRNYLFLRKNKDDQEAKEFYFLGEIRAEGQPEQITMDKTGDSAFEIQYHLDNPVRDDIYDYIIENNIDR